MTGKRNSTVLILCETALCIALQVVLSKLVQVSLVEKEYNFGFVPIAVAACFLGPLPAVLTAVLGDIAGSLLFPSGAYFAGFTLTALLSSLFYVLFLKKGKIRVLNIALSVALSEAVNWLMNSAWISILYTKKLYGVQLLARAPMYLVEIPFQFLVLFVLLNSLKKTGFFANRF